MSRPIIANNIAENDTEAGALESLHDVVAFSSADWGQAKDMAWVYGIVCGWDSDPDEDNGSMDELAQRLGWDAAKVARLRRLRNEFRSLSGMKGHAANGLRSLTIYGASDDLVEVEGYVNEEFDVARGTALLMVVAPDGAHVGVEAEWCPVGPIAAVCGGWQLSVHHIDPDWTYPIRLGVRPDRDTDPAVHLDVPEGTTVTRWGGDQS